jgi:hypothetical protein
MPKGIAYSLIDYCELVNCTGRFIWEDKAGYIEHLQSPILARLGLDSEQWSTLSIEFEQHFSTAVGSDHMLQQFKHHKDHRRIRGIAKARVLLHDAWTVQHYRQRSRDILHEGEQTCPDKDTREPRQRERLKMNKSRALLDRLREYEDDTLRFMENNHVPFTNNQG